MMEVGNGGSALGFSQEVVQEFQVATVNMDLSTGATASGVVNVATRSGSNQLHGSGFFFFRDHHLSAYPGLHRNPSIPIRSSSGNNSDCHLEAHFAKTELSSSAASNALTSAV